MSQVPQDVEEFIAEKQATVSITDSDGAYSAKAIHPIDLRMWMSGHVRVPAAKIDAAVKHLEHLKDDIIIRSQMQDDYVEGVVFVGCSAWLGLVDTIDMLNASKGE